MHYIRALQARLTGQCSGDETATLEIVLSLLVLWFL
jgi:hypothetical protein